MLLMLSKIFLPYFSFVPMSTIAAMLALVSLRMIDFKHLSHLWKFDRKQFYISIFTALLCVVLDTMSGLIIGSVLSLIIYAHGLSIGMAEMQIFSYTGGSDFAAESEKVFLGEVDVSTLDSYSLGDHLVHLFTEYRKRHWGRTPRSPRRDSNPPPPKTSGSDANIELGEREPLARSSSANLYTRSVSRSIVAANLAFDSMNDSLLPLISTADAKEYFMPTPGRDYAVVYRIAGQITYVNGRAHEERAERAASRLEGFKTVVISMRTVWTIDFDGIDSLHTMIKIFEESGMTCVLDGVTRVRAQLKGHAFFEHIVEDGRCVEKWTQANEE